MTCVGAADHWDGLAEGEIRIAQHEAAIGLPFGDVATYYHRADMYRQCARTLRLQASTGVPHCMCHERPITACPYSGQGVRV
mgnify:FL=1